MDQNIFVTMIQQIYFFSRFLVINYLFHFLTYLFQLYLESNYLFQQLAATNYLFYHLLALNYLFQKYPCPPWRLNGGPLITLLFKLFISVVTDHPALSCISRKAFR